MSSKSAKGTQVQSKPQNPNDQASKDEKGKKNNPNKGPCPWLCNLVPTNVPAPGPAQKVLHPRKDVFVLKVAKIGANGDRRCKMELELVTPKYPDKKVPGRVDTRETQCDPDPPPCTCIKPKKKKK